MSKCLLPISESMTIELVLENPLKISMVLMNITLLWKFLPVNYEGGNQENPEHQPQVLTNEAYVRDKMVIYSLRCTVLQFKISSQILFVF